MEDQKQAIEGLQEIRKHEEKISDLYMSVIEALIETLKMIGEIHRAINRK